MTFLTVVFCLCFRFLLLQLLRLLLTKASTGTRTV